MGIFRFHQSVHQREVRMKRLDPMKTYTIRITFDYEEGAFSAAGAKMKGETLAKMLGGRSGRAKVL